MLTILNMSLVSIMLIMGMFCFIFNHKHLLSMLLSLEYMILSLFFLLFIYLYMLNNELFFCLMFLVFSVCEGVLGLSILVSMVRTHGNDYFQSFNIL